MSDQSETILMLQQDIKVGEIHATALADAKSKCEVEGIRLRLRNQYLETALAEMTAMRDGLLGGQDD